MMDDVSPSDVIRFIKASGRKPYREIMNSPAVMLLISSVASQMVMDIKTEGRKELRDTRDPNKRSFEYIVKHDVRPGENRSHAIVKLDVPRPHSFREAGHNRKYARINGPKIRSIMERELRTAQLTPGILKRFGSDVRYVDRW